ncbi:hypothetical protein chiPu_0031121 [Chiloscyllium punctatum]|uniref:Uncharacterized protein n=1 Tax=Chiloscyllium punctatum TaxID=137246 RepID=A0A401TWI4_CHIPU|nr:hypothetical protein [Chiloscyllium punctatum]
MEARRACRAVAAKQRRLVPLAGIEPALLAELDFESSASTSSATGAFAMVQAGSGRGSRSAADYSGRPVTVNPRGCDCPVPRQRYFHAIRPGSSMERGHGPPG